MPGGRTKGQEWFLVPFPMSQALRQVVCSSRTVHTSAHLNQRVKVGCSWQWEERPRQVGASSRWVLRLGVSGKAGSGP